MQNKIVGIASAIIMLCMASMVMISCGEKTKSDTTQQKLSKQATTEAQEMPSTVKRLDDGRPADILGIPFGLTKDQLDSTLTAKGFAHTYNELTGSIQITGQSMWDGAIDTLICAFGPTSKMYGQVVINSNLNYAEVEKRIEAKYDATKARKGEAAIGGMQWMWARGDGSPVAIIWSNSKPDSTSVTMIMTDKFFY